MSEIVYFIDGLSCPFYKCDVCGRRITDPGWAMTVWGENLRERVDHKFISVAHVHKRRCLDLFESRLPEGERLMTAELTDNLEMLVDNTMKGTVTRLHGVTPI